MKSRFATLALFVTICLLSRTALADWVETFTGGFDLGAGWVFADNSNNVPPDATSVTPAGGVL